MTAPTPTDAQLEAMRRGEEDGDSRAVQLFITSWLAAVAGQELPLTPPFTVEIATDARGDYVPRFWLQTAGGFEYEVRVLPADTAVDLVRTWRDGLHSPTRSSCPGCGAELMRVGLAHLAYTVEVCNCGSPEYDHLAEQLWHRDCHAQSGVATVAES